MAGAPNLISWVDTTRGDGGGSVLYARLVVEKPDHNETDNRLKDISEQAAARWWLRPAVNVRDATETRDGERRIVSKEVGETQ